MEHLFLLEHPSKCSVVLQGALRGNMSMSSAATDGQPADDLAPSRRNITTLEGQCQCNFPSPEGLALSSSRSSHMVLSAGIAAVNLPGPPCRGSVVLLNRLNGTMRGLDDM